MARAHIYCLLMFSIQIVCNTDKVAYYSENNALSRGWKGGDNTSYLWAIVSTVLSRNSSLIVFCINRSVSKSTLAVASSMQIILKAGNEKIKF